MTKTNRASILQDAYWLTMRAMKNSDGTHMEHSPSEALQLAQAKAKEAGWSGVRVRRLAGARALLVSIIDFALGHGINARCGECTDCEQAVCRCTGLGTDRGTVTKSEIVLGIEALRRTQEEWGRWAQEPVVMRAIEHTIYAFGSELAVLRVSHKYRHHNSVAVFENKGDHRDLGAWVLRLELAPGTTFGPDLVEV